MDTEAVDRAGREVERSDALDVGVRVGLVAYGLVHLVVAWLGVQLALGSPDDRPDAHGALHELAQKPLGETVLVLVALGMLILVAWRVLELLFEHRHEDAWDRWRHRAIAVGTGIAYAALGLSALGVVRGEGRSQPEETWTSRLMSWPAGPWLVGLAGIAFLGYTGAMVWRALTGRHRKHLDAEGRRGDSGTAYVLLGSVGYVAKGLAFGIVGVLFLWAAWTHDPRKSGGLDQALAELLGQPFGPVLLVGISAGLACFGLFQLVRARHLSR